MRCSSWTGGGVEFRDFNIAGSNPPTVVFMRRSLCYESNYSVKCVTVLKIFFPCIPKLSKMTLKACRTSWDVTMVIGSKKILWIASLIVNCRGYIAIMPLKTY